jgi:hypothetical protein
VASEALSTFTLWAAADPGTCRSLVGCLASSVSGMSESQHLSTYIERSAAEVYAYVGGAGATAIRRNLAILKRLLER